MKGGDLLWRGTEKRVKDIKIFTPRTDRQPRDMDPGIHKYMDDMFKEYHGWKARSEGVFTTTDRRQSSLYGKPYVFFPIGNYKYLWNPKVNDLMGNLKELLILDISDLDYSNNKDNLEDLIKGYKSTNLKQAAVRNSEVMFLCKSYYLVDSGGPNLYQRLEELLE
jgi:hypothetical protein